MEKYIPVHLQEVIFGSSDSSLSKKISKLEKQGEIRKIAPRIYTSNHRDAPEDIIRRNIFFILGNLFQGAVLSHRSALEFRPTATGQLFLTYRYTKKIKLPGIEINFLKGNGPVAGDIPFSGKLYVSQRPRAFLENLQISRKSGADSKTLTSGEIEEKLEQIIRVHGEEEINAVRDQAREVAGKLGMDREFKKLDKLCSALSATRPSKILTSPVAAARAFGLPCDPSRIELFEILFHELNQNEFRNYDEKNKSQQAFRNFAFFESYFSNYIEGTRFEIEEAKQIIETQRSIPSRNEDSHDILGTYQIVSNRKEMAQVPGSPEELMEILKHRHSILLSARPDKRPGVFKDNNTFAGSTVFVDKNLVMGTLIKGFDYYQALRQAFSKAAYMMFMISEVHPFLDGNGRMARIMMNAEMVKDSRTKIIIPTVYRDDYLLTLRRLTRQRDPAPYIRMLYRALEFSSTIFGEDLEAMQQDLTDSHAFMEHTEGQLVIINKSNNV